MNNQEKKLQILYRLGELRVHGDNAAKFANSIGVIIRHHAPLQFSGWAKVPLSDKKTIYARIRVIYFLFFILTLTYLLVCSFY